MNQRGIAIFPFKFNHRTSPGVILIIMSCSSGCLLITPHWLAKIWYRIDIRKALSWGVKSRGNIRSSNSDDLLVLRDFIWANWRTVQKDSLTNLGRQISLAWSLTKSMHLKLVWIVEWISSACVPVIHFWINVLIYNTMRVMATKVTSWILF